MIHLYLYVELILLYNFKSTGSRGKRHCRPSAHNQNLLLMSFLLRFLCLVSCVVLVPPQQYPKVYICRSGSFGKTGLAHVVRGIAGEPLLYRIFNSHYVVLLAILKLPFTRALWFCAASWKIFLAGRSSGKASKKLHKKESRGKTGRCLLALGMGCKFYEKYRWF